MVLKSAQSTFPHVPDRSTAGHMTGLLVNERRSAAAEPAQSDLAIEALRRSIAEDEDFFLKAPVQTRPPDLPAHVRNYRQYQEWVEQQKTATLNGDLRDYSMAGLFTVVAGALALHPDGQGALSTGLCLGVIYNATYLLGGVVEEAALRRRIFLPTSCLPLIAAAGVAGAILPPPWRELIKDVSQPWSATVLLASFFALVTTGLGLLQALTVS